MNCARLLLPVVLAAAAAPAAAAPAPKVGIVFCAPGYPGTSAEAQPRLDELAAALSQLSGVPREKFSAIYLPSEKEGLARLAAEESTLAFVPLPFFLQHEGALKLTAKMAVVQKSGAPLESWQLVAKKGSVAKPADLEGWSVFSTAGYSPAFVRAGALPQFGPMPASVKVLFGPAVLSSLRKAAAGEKIAVLLDATQAASLSSLPFAGELEVIVKGPAMPSGVLCTIGDRFPASDFKGLSEAFLKLSSDPKGTSALEGMRLSRFAPLDESALAASRKAMAQAAK